MDVEPGQLWGRLDSGHLEVLRELADRGSVTAVAEATHQSPSAVSQQLKALQSQLEVVLVEKVGRILRADILARVLAKRPLDRAAKSFPAQDIRAGSSGGRVAVQIDGELRGHLPMFFRIEPTAIRLIR